MKKPRRSLLRKILMFLLIGFLLSLPLGYGFMEYSTQPQFCNSCHNMEPYVKSWENSSHGKAGVNCIQCHFEPGVLETLQGKWKASTQLIKYITSTEGSKPWAQVSDQSCMRSGCHSARLLEGKVDYKVGRTSIPFDHTPHLLEMRRDKKLRCTSCHSQIVQGQHLTVTATTCLLCHFKSAASDPKLSACRTCHTPPVEPIDVGAGFKFEHAEYLKRGVNCETCHAGVTQGTGEVPKHRCAACHAIQEHIDRYNDTEFLHRQHVTLKKVDCLECHTEMTHALRPREDVSKGECAQCHSAGHGIGEAFYRGEGGRGVPATPNPMYLARVGCAGCHRHLAGDAAATATTLPAKEVACISCHGTKYDGMLGRWQKTFGPAAESVLADATAARAAASAAGGASSELVPKLDDAVHNATLVVKDGSRGAHNPWFARKLLDAAHAASDAAWSKLDPSRARSANPLAPKFTTKLECALVCHAGIEEQKITVAGTRFEHARHLTGLRDCDACHTASAYGPGGSGGEHGKLLPAAKNCIACHHGADAPKTRDCASCHKDADRFLRGVSADGEQGGQMMAKIACAECHGDVVSTPRASLRASVQANCDRCHKDKYAKGVTEWTSDSDAWFAEAEGRLAKIDARVAAGKTTAAKAAAARAIVMGLRRAVPAHNVIQFEDVKEAFDAAASAAEK